MFVYIFSRHTHHLFTTLLTHLHTNVLAAGVGYTNVHTRQRPA